MEFVNKATAQLVELYKSMTAGARVTTGVLLVVLVVSLAWLFNQQVAGSDAYLMGGEPFSAGQLRDMQAAFGKAGLEAQCDGARIKVPRGQESKYMAALADAGALPAEFGHYMQKAVSTSGFIRVPHSQQEAAWQVAKQQELQLIISGMHGIDRAAVQIDQEKIDEFPRGRKSITAAVMVRPKGNQPLDDRTVRTLKQMVASSVAGLKPDAVTVVDMSTNDHFGASSADGAIGGGDYAEHKKRHELQWQRTISHVLEYIPGVLVSTNVELDPAISNEETLIHDAEPAAERDRPTASAESTTQAEGLGRVAEVVADRLGLASREPSDAAPQKTRAAKQTHVVRQGSTPKRVTVSVAVPSTYYLAVWHKENPTPAGAARLVPDPRSLADVESREKAKIEQLVANLLPGHDARGASAGQVAVSTFYPLASHLPAETELRERAMAWAVEHGSTLTLVGLSLVGLLVLHSMVRSLGRTESRATGRSSGAAPLFSVVDDSFEPDSASGLREPFARGAARSATLSNELADVVREDPEAAVSVLRSWIGNAS